MFKFNRRINRSTYFAGQTLNVLYIVVLSVVFTILDKTTISHFIVVALTAVFLLSLAPWIIYCICLTRQRANDISGEHALLWTFIAFFFLGWIIGVIPGQKKPNKYGAVPKKGVNLRSVIA